LKSALDFGEGRKQGRAARIDDDIPGSELGAAASKRFTNASFDSIPDDGRAERARNGEADPGAG
jgi:hypothetical protein